MAKVKKIDNFVNNFFEDNLEKSDREIFKSNKYEYDRQQHQIELITSLLLFLMQRRTLVI